MLEVWGYDKGWITQDVTNPMKTTAAMKDVEKTPPAAPDISSAFAYIADNHRQEFVVHHEAFTSQCKYLVRMLDAWEAVRAKTGAPLPAGWAHYRELANRFYVNGIPGGTPTGSAAKFEQMIGGIISDVVETSHAYHVARVTDALVAAMQNAPQKPDGAPLALADLLDASAKNTPKGQLTLDDELNFLTVGYVNTTPEVQAKLLAQFRDRITKGEASDKLADLNEARVLTHLMAALQERVDYSRAQIGAFEQINASIKARVDDKVKDYLTEVNLEEFVRGVAKGEFTTSEWRLVDGEVRSAKRQLTPEHVARDIKVIEGIATMLRWDNARYAKFVREYLDSGDPGLAIRMLRGLHDAFNSANARPLSVQYTDENGQRVVGQIPVSGTSLGGALFSAAAKGAGVFGQLRTGKELFDKLAELDQRGLSPDAKGAAYASILSGVIGLGDLAKKENWFRGVPLQGLIGAVALGGYGGIGAGGAAGAEATRDLMWTALQDLSALYMPAVGEAIIIADVAGWAWSAYKLSSTRSEVIDLLVENGVWNPGTPQALKALPAGQLPALVGVRDREGGTTWPKEVVARLGFKATLIKSKTELEPREAMLDLAHDGGYVESDPLIAVDIDSVNQTAGPWLQMLHVGGLPANPRKWTADALRALGITVGRREDALTPPNPAQINVNAQLSAETWWPSPGLGEHQLRLIGYLVAGFWAKRQVIMEKEILAAVEKEAARRIVDKLTEDGAVAGDWDFVAKLRPIDDSVKDLDRALWPRVARSTDPFPGDEYVPDQDVPIFTAFAADTQRQRDRIAELEAFVKDAARETIEFFDGNAKVMLDRPAAAKQAAALVNRVRDRSNEYVDGYANVQAVLDRGKARVAEGHVTIDPFHVRLAPGTMSLSLGGLAEGLGPAAGDVDRAKKWLNGYEKERTDIARDVADRAKGGPVPQSFLDWLTAPRNDAASPAHPLWPELTRLRYQIHTLGLMKAASGDMALAEAQEYVRRMTIKAGEAAPVPQSFEAAKREEIFDTLIAAMEAEYQRLLSRLNNLFEITVTIDPVKPYIGQEATVTAKPQFPEGEQPPALGASGFPAYVTRLRWTIKDPQGNAVGPSAETERGEWKAKFPRAGAMALVEVNALDKNGHAVATNSIGALPQPLTLVGSVALAEGDYEGQPISVVAGGAARGGTGNLGSFRYEIMTFDEAQWSGGSAATAFVSIEGQRYASNTSAVTFAASAGLLQIKDELRFRLPYTVAVTVDVLDRAHLDVPGADVTLLVGGGAGPIGRAANVKLKKGDGVGAHVEFAPLGLAQDVAPVAFDPARGRALKLRADLPMFDAGHVTVAGQLVPAASLKPAPEITGGQVANNIAALAVAGARGAFRFQNTSPIDLRASPQLEVHAVATDAARAVYRATTDPVVREIAARQIDLGAIEVARAGVTVKPIRGELFDWSGRPIPAGQGAMTIAGQPAAGSGGVFEGEYTFTNLQEEIIVQGQYPLPSGALSVAQETLSLRQLGNWVEPTPPSYRFKLPFYLPGSLRVAGSTRFENVPENESAPALASFDDAAHGVARTANAGVPFEFVLPVPVQVTEQIALDVRASGTRVAYAGQATTRAPSEPGAADAGEIVLRPTTTVARVAPADQDNAPTCAEIDALVQERFEAGRQAIAACRFSEAGRLFGDPVFAGVPPRCAGAAEVAGKARTYVLVAQKLDAVDVSIQERLAAGNAALATGRRDEAAATAQQVLDVVAQLPLQACFAGEAGDARRLLAAATTPPVEAPPSRDLLGDARRSLQNDAPPPQRPPAPPPPAPAPGYVQAPASAPQQAPPLVFNPPPPPPQGDGGVGDVIGGIVKGLLGGFEPPRAPVAPPRSPQQPPPQARATASAPPASSRPRWVIITSSAYATDQETYQKYPECRFVAVHKIEPYNPSDRATIDQYVAYGRSSHYTNVEALYFNTDQEKDRYVDNARPRDIANAQRCRDAQRARR